MWKNGKVCNDADSTAGTAGGATGSPFTVRPATSAATAPDSSVLLRLVTWLRCVPTAPFERPVVPEV